MRWALQRGDHVMTNDGDRNLLVGILALQMDFIDREQLIAAMNSWVLEKSKRLDQILLEQNSLGEDTRALLVALVEKHLELHGGDAEKSLAALSSLGSVREELGDLGNPQVDATLARVTTKLECDDPLLSETIAAGTPSSEGQRFRILRPHATGGLGKISVAHDAELHREVALKEIQQRYAHDVNNRARFVMEAEITGGLEHPGIVPVYGLGQYADGRPFYAMRFIRGDSLKEATDVFHQAEKRNVSGSSLELRKLLGRFVDVCQAVEYAHSRGVLHRDLKPGNIMLGKYGETLVVDWGLAKAVGRKEEQQTLGETTLQPSAASGSAPTQMGTAVGTPAYMSPEQAAGKLDELGSSSDVYSLGATLYYLLTGQAPIKSDDLGTVLRRVEAGDFPKPRGIRSATPKPLEAICLKAMSLQAKERYESPQQLALEIERWLADEPVAAYRDPLLTRGGRWMRRHRLLVTATSAAALVAMLSLITGVSVLSSKNRQLQTAHQLISTSNQELLAANDRERAAKQLAEDRFELAMDAIEKYYTGASEDVLLKQEGLKDLRENLLGTALDFYQQLKTKLAESSDPESRSNLANAYMAIAKITRLVGDPVQAESAYQQALEIRANLVAENPNSPKYKSGLAHSYNDLGNQQRAIGDLVAAGESFQQAREIQEKLVAEYPNILGLQRDLAHHYTNLGIFQHETGDAGAARKSFQKALEIREKIVANNPSVPEYRNHLAAGYHNLGLYQRETGDPVAAGKAYQQSIKIKERLVAENPNVTEYQSDLAGSYNDLGVLQRAAGDAVAAREYFQQALEIREKVVSEHPAVTENQRVLGQSYHGLGIMQQETGNSAAAIKSYQQSILIKEKLVNKHPAITEFQRDLATSYSNLGDLQRAAGETEAARRAFGRAIELHDRLIAVMPERNSEPIRLLRARTHAKSGDHKQAVVEAEQLDSDQETAGRTLYNLACVFSLSAQAAADDQDHSQEERTRLEEQYAARAIKLLTRAREKGFFDPPFADRMNKDTDFDPIRSREGFQKLVRELEEAGGVR
jgi:serine/threonine protein kinase